MCIGALLNGYFVRRVSAVPVCLLLNLWVQNPSKPMYVATDVASLVVYSGASDPEGTAPCGPETAAGAIGGKGQKTNPEHAVGAAPLRAQPVCTYYAIGIVESRHIGARVDVSKRIHPEYVSTPTCRSTPGVWGLSWAGFILQGAWQYGSGG